MFPPLARNLTSYFPASVCHHSHFRARSERVEKVDGMRAKVVQELSETRANLTRLVETSEGLRADLEKSEGRVAEAEGRAETLQSQLRELEVSSKEKNERDLKDLEGRLTSQFK